jgi:hypothetical protein
VAALLIVSKTPQAVHVRQPPFVAFGRLMSANSKVEAIDGF